MKTCSLAKRIQFHRGIPWEMFGEAWTTAPPKDPTTRVNALRIFGVLIVW